MILEVTPIISIPSHSLAMIDYTASKNEHQLHVIPLGNQPDNDLNISTARIRAHEDSPQTPTDLLSHFPICERAILVRTFLKSLQHILAFLLETLHELLGSGVLGCDAISDGCRDSVDLL
jgi:hypothetical protein